MFSPVKHSGRFTSFLSAFVGALLLVSAVVSSLASVTVPVSALDQPVIERARNAYLYNIENEQVLFTKDADQQIFPASMV